jgi:hypothetical protein
MSMPCAGSDAIWARRQVTTDPCEDMKTAKPARDITGGL